MFFEIDFRCATLKKVWHIYATQSFDYKPFGDLQSAGEENRIGYFGEQRDKESDYFAMGFRLYDPEIGRFLAIDPLLDIQPSQTPYHYCFNNPTSFTDPTGLYPKKEKGDKVQMWVLDDWDLQNSLRMLMENKAAYYEAILDFHRWSANMFSAWCFNKYFYGGGGGGSGRTGTKNEFANGIVVNKYGVIIGETLNSSDKNKVFLYNDENNSLDYLGDVGGVIDISKILPNILDRNADIAKGLDLEEFKEKVQFNGEWDLKDNNNTIFGYAWSLREKFGTTNFFTNDIYFQTASDVGNYHYGYVGRAADISIGILLVCAGLAEQKKLIFDEGKIGKAIDLMWNSFIYLPPILFIPVPPFMDNNIDFLWTTKGMRDYGKKK